jgi:hypothetical protein
MVTSAPWHGPTHSVCVGPRPWRPGPTRPTDPREIRKDAPVADSNWHRDSNWHFADSNWHRDSNWH